MNKFTTPAIAALSAVAAMLALPAAAADLTFTNTTGGATVGAGPYKLTSTNSTYSVLRFINNQPVNFGDLASLSLTYNAIFGGIGAGGARIDVVTDADHDGVEDGDFLIHLGPAGSFVDPTLGIHNSGNLLAQNDIGRYDLGGIGGSAYTNYQAAYDLAHDYGVLRFSVVLDSFGGANKTMVIGKDGLAASSAVTGGVPEPASWALMIVGFGAAGAMLRRRRTLAAHTA
jgi:hypothetical protein